MAVEWIHRIEGLASRRRILLDYVDADRKSSHREIVPFELCGEVREGQAFATMINAYCLSRRANRSFRVDRIVSVGDAETGEILDTDEWVDHLAAGATFPSEDSDVAGDPPRSEPARRSLAALFWCAVLGYIIGRTRVIGVVLAHFHQHWGVWL